MAPGNRKDYVLKLILQLYVVDEKAYISRSVPSLEVTQSSTSFRGVRLSGTFAVSKLINDMGAVILSTVLYNCIIKGCCTYVQRCGDGIKMSSRV